MGFSPFKLSVDFFFLEIIISHELLFNYHIPSLQLLTLHYDPIKLLFRYQNPIPSIKVVKLDDQPITYA
jgi:hypothetical protein